MKYIIKEEMRKRILVLDGAMGTSIQKLNLDEVDFRWSKFKENEINLKGNNDILNLSNPQIIKGIHKRFLLAGADIIETNTFSSNELWQKRYGLSDYVYELNVKGARLAREAILELRNNNNLDGVKFVAGSIGPTHVCLSKESDIIYKEDIINSCVKQVRGLVDGGVDLLFIETVFDFETYKTILETTRLVLKNMDKKLPIVISVTMDKDGEKIYSGEELKIVFDEAKSEDILAIGINCSYGIKNILKAVKALQNYEMGLIVYPNAGLPNKDGKYEETPEKWVIELQKLAKGSFINIVGGCCGTTYEHIEILSHSIKNYSPRSF